MMISACDALIPQSGGLSITLGSTTWIRKPPSFFFPEVAHVTNHDMLSAVFRDEEKMKAEMVLVCLLRYMPI